MAEDRPWRIFVRTSLNTTCVLVLTEDVLVPQRTLATVFCKQPWPALVVGAPQTQDEGTESPLHLAELAEVMILLQLSWKVSMRSNSQDMELYLPRLWPCWLAIQTVQATSIR